jgi:hypothetical protein
LANSSTSSSSTALIATGIGLSLATPPSPQHPLNSGGGSKHASAVMLAVGTSPHRPTYAHPTPGGTSTSAPAYGSPGRGLASLQNPWDGSIFMWYGHGLRCQQAACPALLCRPAFVVSASSCTTNGKAFAVCFRGFAVCLWRVTNVLNPVVPAAASVGHTAGPAAAGRASGLEVVAAGRPSWPTAVAGPACRYPGVVGRLTDWAPRHRHWPSILVSSVPRVVLQHHGTATTLEHRVVLRFRCHFSRDL